MIATRDLSKVFKCFNRMMRQGQRATLAYRPQANGQQQRSVQTVMNAVKMYVADEFQRDWDDYVIRLELAINTSPSYLLGKSSFFLVHGWDAKSMMEAMLPSPPHDGLEVDAWKWRNKVARLHEMAILHAREIHQRLKRQLAERHNELVEEKRASTTKTSYNIGDSVWIFFNWFAKGQPRSSRIYGMGHSVWLSASPTLFIGLNWTELVRGFSR